MRWTDYPTRNDFSARRHGIERAGDLISDAPGSGCRWVLTPSKKFAKVRIRNNEAYRILTELDGDTDKGGL